MNRKDENPEEQAKGQKALLQHRALFEEEKIRHETLKAQLAAEPTVPKADDMDTDLGTAGSLAQKELVLRRMATAKVDDDGTSLSAQRVRKNLESSRRHHNSAEGTDQNKREKRWNPKTSDHPGQHAST